MCITQIQKRELINIHAKNVTAFNLLRDDDSVCQTVIDLAILYMYDRKGNT